MIDLEVFLKHSNPLWVCIYYIANTLCTSLPT